jgi:hypothetical protein
LQDLVGYIEMSREFHPVWKDLAIRRVRLGDSTEDLLRRYPAPMQVKYGPYVDFEYEVAPGGQISFCSLCITAKDGRLVSARAGSCTWEHVFFESKEEHPLIDAAYCDSSIKHVVTVDKKLISE